MGESFTPNRLTRLVRGYVQGADLGKSGSCTHPARMHSGAARELRSELEKMLGEEES